jgi:hypothetical protein
MFYIHQFTEQEKEIIETHVLKWPIGKQFEYLGVNMVVTNNFECSLDRTMWTIFIEADYADKDGVIRNIRINPDCLTTNHEDTTMRLTPTDQMNNNV